MARPSSYTTDKGLEVCALVAEGKTLRQIDGMADMPSMTTIMRWSSENPEFREHYARAREEAADILEADILTRAMAVSPESANADRVAIDAMKWVAARRNPKKYGDRVKQEITGKDGGPIQTRELSDAERANRLIAILERAGQGGTGPDTAGGDADMGADTGAADQRL